MNAPIDHETRFDNQDSLLDVARLRAIAALADTRGNVRFTQGGGVLFDTPMTRTERVSIPAPQATAVRYLDLPQDRFHRDLAKNAGFAAFVRAFSVAHMRAGYRLVVIPLSGRLSGAQLRAIADMAEAFGHSSLRLTADVSIRLPNVPVALLRPLYAGLRAAGLASGEPARLAA